MVRIMNERAHEPSNKHDSYHELEWKNQRVEPGVLDVLVREGSNNQASRELTRDVRHSLRKVHGG